MTQKQIEDFLLSLPDMWLDYPFGEDSAVYKYGTKPDGKIVAIIAENSKPLQVSLKCDSQLAITLREQYETVQPGHHLNKKHWNTIVCTGQMPDEEIIGLVRLSYRLVSGIIV